MAIAMAGDRLTDRSEQEALLQILLKTGKERGWPASAEILLKDPWCWMGQFHYAF